MLIAFNAAPGTIAPMAEGAYGPYAKALAEMMREGGLPLNDVFERVRLRVSDATQGAQVPWHASNVAGSFVFFERAPDAPPPSVAANEVSPVLRSRPIRELGAQEAYIAALDRDTLPDYVEFLDSYATDPLANRVRAIVAARREALIWRRTRWLDTPSAYWSYLRLYSDGPHVEDCYRRLAFLHASLELPAEFSAVDYDVPPPLPDESAYFQQPAIFLGDPAFDFPPPPAIPPTFLPPPPPDFVELLPPEPPQEVFALPTPIYTPVPVWVRPPRFVQPPPANNVIFPNLHNKVALDRRGRSFTVTDQGGHSRTFQAPGAFQNAEHRDAGRQAGPHRQLPASDANVGPALPPSVARLEAMNNGRRLDRAQRSNQSSPLPLSGAREPRPPGALGGSAAAGRQLPTQRMQPKANPLWGDRPQQPGNGVAAGGTQRMQPLPRFGEPLPKPPSVPGTATGTTRAQGPLGGKPAASFGQAGQPQAKAALPRAAAARPQGPAQPPQALPKVPPPSAAQPAPTRQPQEVNRQSAQQPPQPRAQQQQAAAARAQQQPAQQAAAARRSNRDTTGRRSSCAATGSTAGRGSPRAATGSTAGRRSSCAATGSTTGRRSPRWRQPAGRRSSCAATGSTAGRRSPCAATGSTTGRRSPCAATGSTAGRRSPRAAAGSTAGRRSSCAATGSTTSRRSPRSAAGRRSSCAATGSTAGRRSSCAATGSATGRRGPRRRSGSCITSYRRCSCSAWSAAAALNLRTEKPQTESAGVGPPIGVGSAARGITYGARK